jgi:hypothetical protein
MENKIFISEDNQRIELTGERLEAFLAQQEIDAAESIARKAEAEAKAATKAAQRQDLLERLGITEDEARLLLG